MHAATTYSRMVVIGIRLLKPQVLSLQTLCYCWYQIWGKHFHRAIRRPEYMHRLKISVGGSVRRSDYVRSLSVWRVERGCIYSYPTIHYCKRTSRELGCISKYCELFRASIRRAICMGIDFWLAGYGRSDLGPISALQARRIDSSVSTHRFDVSDAGITICKVRVTY